MFKIYFLVAMCLVCLHMASAVPVASKWDNLPKCPIAAMDKQVHPDDCHMYVLCYYGHPYDVGRCPGSKVLNPHTLICDDTKDAPWCKKDKDELHIKF